MLTRNKKILIAAATLLIAVPALAVFNEKDLAQTLSVLRFELKQETAKTDLRTQNIDTRGRSQHSDMIRLTKRCNELALMLYSQSQDFTFDMTYALEEVTNEYETFNERRLPYDDIVARLDAEIDRYSRLIESLRRLPPQLKEIEELPDSLAYHNDSIKTDMPAFMALARRGRNREGTGTRGGAPGLKPGAGPSQETGLKTGLKPGQKPGQGATPRRQARTFRTKDGRMMMLDSLNVHGHRMAFYLDAKGQEDRDSCIHYATTLLKMYSRAKDGIMADSEYYDDTSLRLKESYDYAHDRYQTLQKKMITSGQDNFFYVIGNFRTYLHRAIDDASRKYSRRSVLDGSISRSQWRGPIITGTIFFVLFAIVFATLLSLLVIRLLRRFSAKFRSEAFMKRKQAITAACGTFIFGLAVTLTMAFSSNHFISSASNLLIVLSAVIFCCIVSMLVRNDADKVSPALKMLIPVFIMGVVVISFRVMFLPNRLLTILLPPISLGCAIWQFITCRRQSEKAATLDRALSWVSFIVMTSCTVMFWAGYCFLGIIVAVWWLFQLFAAEVLLCAGTFLKKYYDRHIVQKISQYKAKHSDEVAGPSSGKGEYIRVTWLHDLLSGTAIPVLAVLSLPLCVKYALGSFDMTEICNSMFSAPFFDLNDSEGAVILHMSVNKIVAAAVLFFIFRFIGYAAKSFYRMIKLERVRKASGRRHIHTNEVNLTLANNIIAILVWGIYIITVVVLLKIPVGALSIIAAGLATGIGLAMKDILNNFIYGIQLMSGRLRVGDWIVCDGVRGRVSAISYQSTQIECEDGSVMSFLNTALFNNNFRNLTRNNSYEYIKIIVGIPYGENVAHVRDLILEAIRPEQRKDSYGRDIVDLKKGVSVALDDFGESSVNIAIKQHVLVTERWGYIARVKEIVYNVFNDNNISIPFNQLDIHVVPEDGKNALQ